MVLDFKEFRMRRMNLPRFRFNSFPVFFSEHDMPVGQRFPGGQPPSAGLPTDFAEEPIASWEELWIDLGGEA
jgi:hypothetical protein